MAVQEYHKDIMQKDLVKERNHLHVEDLNSALMYNS